MKSISKILILFCGIFILLSQYNVYGHRQVNKNRPMVDFKGQVLGTEDDIVYTYVIRAKPTSSLTPTIAITITPTSASKSKVMDDGEELVAPTSAPIIQEGNTIQTSADESQQSFPASITQFPTATPYAQQSSSSAPTENINGGSSSSEKVQNMPPPPTKPQGAISTPYPTRPPSSHTVINKTQGEEAPQHIPVPTPSSIPDSLRGKSSTIVIEMPAKAPDPLNPHAPVPTPTPLILKGEDMKTIKIKVPEPKVNTPETAATSSSQDLNITIERKQGEGIAISQEEFVIQKGVQTISITKNETDGNTLAIGKNDIKAQVSMPISVNPVSNILTVDTSIGAMKVTIMPDDAVAITRELNIIDARLNPDDIVLEMINNQLQYRIQATKQEKLFWIIPISVPREIFVAADTGSLLSIKKSGFYDFITLFTF